MERFREYRTVVNDIAQTEELAGDADMRDLAKAELKSLTARRDTARRRDEGSADSERSQ